jgi:serine/threonine protein kinase
MTSMEPVTRARLGELQQIGKGGQGFVYLAPDLTLPGERGPLVFKEYRSRDVSGSGLERMTSLRLRLEDRDRQVLDLIANWPLRVVEDADGRTAGVILPLIPQPFFHEIHLPTGKRKRLPRDGQNLSASRERLDAISVPFAGIGDRYRFCRDLAFAVGFLHRRDVCIGDISFANASFAFDLDPCVYLVDCDAFRLKGNAPVVPQLHTPDWIPPEGSRVQSERTDLYKLGLFILRVLAPRPLGAQNRDPSWADRTLDPAGRQLLRRALGADPSARPAARDWYRHLNALLRARSLPTTRHRSRMPKAT